MSDPLRPDEGVDRENASGSAESSAPPDDTTGRDGGAGRAEPGPTASLSEIAVGEPGDRATRRTTLTMVGISVLFGVALVAAAPVVVDAVLDARQPQDPPAVAASVTSPHQSPGTTQPSRNPSSTPTRSDDTDDDTTGNDEKNAPKSDEDGPHQDPDDSGSEQDGATGTDDGTGTSGGSSDGSGTGSGSGGGSDTGSGDNGSGGDDSGSGDGPRYSVVRDSQSFTLDKVCFPGQALDLDSGRTGGESAPQAPYEFWYGGCAPNIEGNIATSQRTAILGGSGRPAPGDCANAAKNGGARGKEQLPAGARLCLLTDSGNIAYVLIAEHVGGQAGSGYGALRITVTTWK